MISGKGLSVRSPDGNMLLKNLSFSLEKGDRLAFTGPNGCGKSTLLREIAGLENNSLGIIRRIDIGKISYLPTRPLDLLLPWSTVEESVAFFSRLASRRGVDVSGVESDYGESLGYSLAVMKTKEVYKLSSGQQALLAVYSAMMQRPALLVADEVFSTLSKTLRISVAKIIVESGVSLICASHDSDFIESLSARVVPLDNYMVNEA